MNTTAKSRKPVASPATAPTPSDVVLTVAAIPPDPDPLSALAVAPGPKARAEYTSNAAGMHLWRTLRDLDAATPRGEHTVLNGFAGELNAFAAPWVSSWREKFINQIAADDRLNTTAGKLSRKRIRLILEDMVRVLAPILGDDE